MNGGADEGEQSRAEDTIKMITQVSIPIMSFLVLCPAQLKDSTIVNLPPYPKSLPSYPFQSALLPHHYFIIRQFVNQRYSSASIQVNGYTSFDPSVISCFFICSEVFYIHKIQFI